MKYRKKPVVVEAIQLTETLFWESYRDGWLKKLPAPFDSFHFSGTYNHGDKKIYSIFVSVKTLEGIVKAELNDWIIKGIKGEFYPCKPDIFEKTYEKVEEKK